MKLHRRIPLLAATLGLCLSLSAGAAGTLDKIKASKSIGLGYRENAIPFSYIGDDNQPWLGRLLYYTLDAGVGFPILRRPKRVDSHRVFSVGILYTCGLARGNYLSTEGAKIE